VSPEFERMIKTRAANFREKKAIPARRAFGQQKVFLAVTFSIFITRIGESSDPTITF